jgi:hypothetical protein
MKNSPYSALLPLRIFAACAKFFNGPPSSKNGDLLAPGRQVLSFLSFAAFASLREIFRALAGSNPGALGSGN